jgi:hypothetical protein
MSEKENQAELLGISQERYDLLWKALADKGYTCANVFISDITMKKADDELYDFRIDVYRWNTKSAWVIELAATFVESENRYKISYYKMGKTGKISSGVGRQSRPIKL